MKLLLGICRLFGILAVTSVWLAATKAAAKGEGTESGAGSLLSGQVRFFSNGQELGEASSLSVAVGDLDGDGDLDAVVGNIGLNRVWRNDGHGRFQRTRGNFGGEWTYGIGLHDLDRDGDLDVYAANYGSADTVWLNTGDGRFIKSAQNLVAARSMAVALGDLDGDGDADALVGTNGEGGRILLNTGNGIFEERTGSLGDAPTYGVALGDLDGDGDFDAICANNGVESESWINDGEGRFTHGEGTSGNTFAARNSWGVALGDLDRDGDLDAVFANDGLNTIWYNDGRAGFREINVSQEGGSTFDIALRDVDGNETIDIFAANYYHPSGTVSLSTGDGRFSDASENFPSESHFGIALGDFDGDGDQDAWVANRNGPNRVWLNGGLSPESAESVQRPPNFIVVLADDLGYGDVGPFGAKDVHTPNLDRLAREGIRLTSFYAHPVCAPARAALMTGSYPIRVAEPGNRKGYRIILHPEEITIAEILNSGGYATACIGKWHLAGEGEEPWEYYNGEFDPDARIPDHPGRTGPFRPEYLPNEQGFGYYFGTPLFNGYLRYVDHLQAVRSGKWKLVLPREKSPPWTYFFGRLIEAIDEAQLFDLETDVAETRNLAGEYPETVNKLWELVERARADLGDYNRVGDGARFFDPGPKRPDIDAWRKSESGEEEWPAGSPGKPGLERNLSVPSRPGSRAAA